MKTLAPSIRPLIDDDAAWLEGIERLCFESRWHARDFRSFLFPTRGVGWVAERKNMIVGYVLCEALASRLQLVRIAVHPRHWGQGIGKNLLRVLKSGLRDEGRDRILCDVSEHNAAAQLFLKHCGFQAVGAVEGFFPSDGSGAIKMEFRLVKRDPQLDFFSFRRSRQI